MVQVFVRTPPGQLSVQINTNDSLECRNYHSSMAMDLSKQTARAADIHTRYLLSNKATCIVSGKLTPSGVSSASSAIA